MEGQEDEVSRWKRGVGATLFLCALLSWLICLGKIHCDRGCEARQPIVAVPLTPIDASVPFRSIDERLDGAVQHGARDLERIEWEHARAIDQFTKEQEREYASIRDAGPEAVEAWINDWYAQQRRRNP